MDWLKDKRVRGAALGVFTLTFTLCCGSAFTGGGLKKCQIFEGAEVCLEITPVGQEADGGIPLEDVSCECEAADDPSKEVCLCTGAKGLKAMFEGTRAN